MSVEIRACICGASDDLPALTEHITAAIDDGYGTDHALTDADEPTAITAARDRATATTAAREALADATGMTITDIANALRGVL